jgi:hypothetical protein
MIRTTINAGVCGFHSTVAARSDDMQMVTLEIDGVVLKVCRAHLLSDCP